ncbi:ISWI chromatin-remodeling complex ATPase ISW2 [Sclerotinia borealis F-4128]|uniref:ISWI chromatin-remodeling complex ATPase ISW2 n=1 Tax=Sclerotinia borealis (strain F-4128) TaxID=1432307 RepID=W9C6P9_SCLBF|nr:ISWI chromatin-remodeling complex ATPase ISW2 [Sclerotinia borealis F-4128]
MDRLQTPSQDGIVASSLQNKLTAENIEEFGVVPDPAIPSKHTTPSQSHQQPIDHPDIIQTTQEDEEEPQEDKDTILHNSPPLKRQMRDRRSHAKENTGTTDKRARISPMKPNSGKIFDTKAKIREEITSATLAQRNTFLVEKQDYFLPLLPQNNYIQKLITQNIDLSEEEKVKLPAFVPYQQLETQPKGIKATLKPYQLSGLSYMVYLYRNGVNGILGDDMGLGKTLQTLSLIQYLKENHPTTGKGKLQRPFLIICPLSVLGSWMTETEKWTDLRVVRFHGGREERGRLKHIIAGGIDKLGNLSPQATRKRKYKANRDPLGREVVSLDSDDDNNEDDDMGVDLVVTTYESYKSEQSWLKGVFVWRYVVLDEGQIAFLSKPSRRSSVTVIKNHASEVSRSLQGLKAEYRLLLSGTPLQNDLGELWALFHFLYPEVFVEKTRNLFAEGFNLSRGDYIKDVLVASRHLLELIMLRRTKTSPGVDLGLPPMEEVLLFVPLSPLQKLWYERLIKKTDTAILHELFNNNSTQEQTSTANLALEPTSASNSSSKRTTWQSLMNLVMQLRKVCNHPYHFEDVEPNPYFPGQHLIEASGKFIVLDKLITELVIEQKKKIIIFSGFTQMLDLVQELLALKGGDGSVFNTCRIDGSTGRARRNLAIRMFMDLTGNHNVFLISTRAGGLGLNLAVASEIILLDQDWNPQVTKQAIGRAYRIGLQKPLTVYHFVAQGTVEEQMMPRIAKKLYLSAKVTESMEDIYTKPSTTSQGKGKEVSNGDDNDMPEMNTGQLMTLIRRGTSAISRPEIDVSKMLEWDWKTTVTMCKDQAADLIKKDDIEETDIDEEEAERAWLAERECVKSKIFNGRAIEDGRPKSRDSAEDFAPSSSKADRKIGKERTVMMGGYMVSKDTINNDQWEAVKTFSSTRPSAPKREKKPDITSQTYCQICKINHKSPLISCKFCPRAYHKDCLTPIYQAKANKTQFACPQHNCVDCKQKAPDVGGMLYKCRWCAKAQCEDCIDWKGFKPIGDTLVELEILGFAKTSSAFYIQCHDCTGKLENDGNFKALCGGLEKKWARELEMLDAVDDEMGVEVDGKIGVEGGADRPIVIDDDDSDVKEFENLPTTMMRAQQAGTTNEFGRHRGQRKAQSGIPSVPRQSGQSAGGPSFTTPTHRGNVNPVNHVDSIHTKRRKSFMDKWNEPSVSQSLMVMIPKGKDTSTINRSVRHAGLERYSGNGAELGGSYSVPRQTQTNTTQSTRNDMSVGPETTAAANEIQGQYGYGTYDEHALNNPYLITGSHGHGNLFNIPRHTGQQDPYYISPYDFHSSGYSTTQSLPRQPVQPQRYVSPYGGILGGHSNASNTPRSTVQPQLVSAPIFATLAPVRRKDENQVDNVTDTGRRGNFMDKWFE